MINISAYYNERVDQNRGNSIDVRQRHIGFYRDLIIFVDQIQYRFWVEQLESNNFIQKPFWLSLKQGLTDISIGFFVVFIELCLHFFSIFFDNSIISESSTNLISSYTTGIISTILIVVLGTQIFTNLKNSNFFVPRIYYGRLVIDTWKKFESSCKKASTLPKDRNKPLVIRSQINWLLQENLIDEQEFLRINQILKIRNAILYEKKDFSLTKKYDDISFLTNITARLKI
ncbi:MAG: hypothetical protein COB24_15050 [Hyphomicrobiales bacterium]|nr:MAG: hypothetical protein COB24_15050 [Hyphomicrobiales bacterium]